LSSDINSITDILLTNPAIIEIKEEIALDLIKQSAYLVSEEKKGHNIIICIQIEW
jgi:superfamily II DNA/RNA helicase